MKTIYPNILSIGIRTVFLAGLIYLSPKPIRVLYNLFFVPRKDQDLIFLSGIIFFLILAYIIWTLCKVLWVKIYADNSAISFHYLYKKIEITGAEIEQYVDTGIVTRRKPINGWLIKLRSGKTIEISEYNIQSRKEIEDFLIFHNVPRTGVKRSWFPYTRKI